MKDFKCEDCGALFDDKEIGYEILCPQCNGRLEQGKFQEPEKPKPKDHNKYGKQQESKHQKKEDENKVDEHVIFSCFFCDKSLRITMPFKSLMIRCSNCNGKYGILSTNGKSGVYLVVPKIEHNSSDNTPPRKPPIPQEVKNALYLFGLDTNSSVNEFKIAYRKAMAEYHPDKVSHLGADLRRLAELKTKEYNTAFEILKKYFVQ